MIGYFNRYSNLLKNDPQQKKMVGTSVTIIWVAILFIFAFVPTLKSALDANTRITKATNINNSLARNVNAANQAIDLVTEEKTNTDYINNALPTNRKAVTAMNELDLSVANHGLTMISLEYGLTAVATAKTKTQKGSTEYSKDGLLFSLQAQGTYPQIRSFIDHLESIPRLTNLTQITIERLNPKDAAKLPDGGMTEEGPILRLVMNGYTYYQTETAKN